jgi:hypothetical protein
VRHAADHADTVPARELRAERTVTDEGQAPLAEARESVCEPEDVLALGQRPDAEKRRRVQVRLRHDAR